MFLWSLDSYKYLSTANLIGITARFNYVNISIAKSPHVGSTTGIAVLHLRECKMLTPGG